MRRAGIGTSIIAIFICVLGATAGVAAAASCPWQTVRMAQLPAPAVALGVSAESSTDVWAVGYWLFGDGAQHAFTEHFNGSGWTAFYTAGIQLNSVLAFSPSDAWAVGERNDQGFTHTLAAHWDGSVWRGKLTQNVSIENNLYAIAGFSENDLWAVGSYFDSNNHATYTLAEHYDGSTWSVVSTPNVALQNVFNGAYAAGANDVWAVGYHDNVGGKDGDPLIEHWDGRQWTVVHVHGLPAVQYAALTAAGGSSPNDIWAVGSSVRTTGAPARTLTVHYDGSEWRYVPSPDVGSEPNLLTGVSVDENGHAVAVGASRNGTAALVERWSGSAWNVDRTALSPFYSQLNAVSLDAHDDVFAVGFAGRHPFDEFSCSQ